MLVAFILWSTTLLTLFSYVFFLGLEEGVIPQPMRRFWESEGEHRCRTWLVNRFQQPFPNVRPYWLINPETKHRLELDCYNADLEIAVEYQGRQHYEDSSLIRRDAYKVQQCVHHGVALIVVPYWVNVEEFLEKEFARLENRVIPTRWF